MFSVSGVSGAASTTKSDSARSAGSVSGPPTRSSIASPNESSSDASPSAVAPACRVVAGSRSPGSRTPSPARRRPARSNRARRSRPSRRGARRPRVAATSVPAGARGGPGSFRLTARIIIITYSAIGRENTPRAFVITIPRSRAAGVSARSTPADAEWTQARRGARARSRSNASAESQPWSSTSTSSTGSSARPSTDSVTIWAPGAAALIRSRSPDR